MVSDDVRRIREEGGTGKRGVTPRNEGLRLVIAVEHRDVQRLAGVAFLDYRWPRRRSPYIAKTTCLHSDLLQCDNECNLVSDLVSELKPELCFTEGSAAIINSLSLSLEFSV